MAWDGDDLAGQMEDTLELQQTAADVHTQRVHLTPEDRARNGEHESLRLSMARIENQLTRATNPAHRTMLERAQQSINAQLEELQNRPR